MTDLNEKALKPCPFCDGPSDFVGRPGAGYEVECKHCGAKSGWGDYGYQVEAKWNRRSLTSATPPDVAKIARSLEALAEHLSDQPLTHADSTDLATIRQAATALRLSAGGGWRTMDSAPKDGTEVLLYREDCGVILGRWIAPCDFIHENDQIAQFTSDEWEEPDWFGADFVSGCRITNDGKPTHWHPLPASPTVEAGHVE